MEELEKECQKFYLNFIDEKFVIGNKNYFDESGNLKKKTLDKQEMFIPPAIIKKMKEISKCESRNDFIELLDSIFEKIINKEFGYKKFCMEVITKSIDENGLFNKMPKLYTRTEIINIIKKVYPSENKEELNKKIDIMFIATNNSSELENLLKDIEKNPRININDIAWKNCNFKYMECVKNNQIEYISKIRCDMADIVHYEKKYRQELFLIIDSIVNEISPIKYHPKFLNDTQEQVNLYNKSHPSVLDKIKIKRIIDIKENLNYSDNELYDEIMKDLKECEQDYLLYDAKKIYDILASEIKNIE